MLNNPRCMGNKRIAWAALRHLPQHHMFGCWPVCAGDLCILHTVAAQQPYKLLVNVSACACATQCSSEDICGFRKFCAASRKRWRCQKDALVADNDANNPCPR